jgi:predicted DNA-binding transcriptional regulator AlpA
MNIHFENLERIEDIFLLLINIKEQLENKSDKKWLNTKELAEYIGYSINSINKLVQNEDLKLDKHYYKKTGKRIFDKEEIDKWITDTDFNLSIDNRVAINNILQSISQPA